VYAYNTITTRPTMLVPAEMLCTETRQHISAFRLLRYVFLQVKRMNPHVHLHLKSSVHLYNKLQCAVLAPSQFVNSRNTVASSTLLTISALNTFPNKTCGHFVDVKTFRQAVSGNDKCFTCNYCNRQLRHSS
jgi:hypothetical protein